MNVQFQNNSGLFDKNFNLYMCFLLIARIYDFLFSQMKNIKSVMNKPLWPQILASYTTLKKVWLLTTNHSYLLSYKLQNVFSIYYHVLGFSFNPWGAIINL